MRVVDMNTARTIRRVFSEEEARLALGEVISSHVRAAAINPELCDYHNGEHGALRHTYNDAVTGSALIGALIAADAARGINRWSTYRRDEPLLVDSCTADYPLDWPLTPSELRRDAALADASIAELAAHLNARLRAEAAQVLITCADYRRDDAEGGTVAERVCANSGFTGLRLGDFADALISSTGCWETHGDWTPPGGAFGDPYTVCGYSWGPLRYTIKLDAHELLGHHLAGNADLTLHRGHLHNGSACLEIIWAAQTFHCCGRDWANTSDQIPFWVQHPHTAEALVRSRDVQCKICGAAGDYSWLTCRTVDDPPGPLGRVEQLAAVPPATLAAAPEALHAVVGIAPQNAEGETSHPWR